MAKKIENISNLYEAWKEQYLANSKFEGEREFLEMAERIMEADPISGEEVFFALYCQARAMAEMIRAWAYDD